MMQNLAPAIVANAVGFFFNCSALPYGDFVNVRHQRTFTIFIFANAIFARDKMGFAVGFVRGVGARFQIVNVGMFGRTAYCAKVVSVNMVADNAGANVALMVVVFVFAQIPQNNPANVAHMVVVFVFVPTPYDAMVKVSHIRAVKIAANITKHARVFGVRSPTPAQNKHERKYQSNHGKSFFNHLHGCNVPNQMVDVKIISKGEIK